jgi:hypothetical protein
MGIVTLRETYELAATDRHESYHSKYDEAKSVEQQFGPPVTRPLKLLAFSLVVLFISLHTVITYGYTFLGVPTVPNPSREYITSLTLSKGYLPLAKRWGSSPDSSFRESYLGF